MPPNLLSATLTLIAAAIFGSFAAQADPLSRTDMAKMFDAAKSEGRVGLARKSRLVDVRPAAIGEVIVTIIRGEGEETRSQPAKDGDMVVRNRCPETGNEEVLISKDKFKLRYEGPLDATAGSGDPSWKPYRPRGVEMLFFRVGKKEGAFNFIAPWGSEMVAKPGDAIVRNPADLTDIYRIASGAFSCTYEILQEPKSK